LIEISMGNTCNGTYCCGADEKKATIERTGNYNLRETNEKDDPVGDYKDHESRQTATPI